jgi:uncharacterized protein Yka (UPF0111/DUF47 family)
VIGVMSYREFAKRSTHELVMDRFEELGDMMCLCKDRACAEKVNETMTKWASDISKDTTDMKPSASEMRRAEQVAKKLTDCMTKLYTVEPQAAPTAERPLSE